MLTLLSIRDVVLIEKLEIAFPEGLSVLTGETGAGKSILLDSLGLALGARAEAGLVRSGAAQAIVAAEFILFPDHPVFALLQENGIEREDEALVVRRVLNADGRSRAFVNDQPVSIALLRRIGELVVEIHGQFDNAGLMNPACHIDLLDCFAGLNDRARAVAVAYQTWRQAIAARIDAERDMEKARRDEDYLRHAAAELAKLDPEEGEDDSLSEMRTRLMQAEKIREGLMQALAALGQKGDVTGGLQTAHRALEKIADKPGACVDEAISALDRAALEVSEAVDQLQKSVRSLELDPHALEEVEDRLFALRALARKHNVAVAELPALKEHLARQLAALDHGTERLLALQQAEHRARHDFSALAQALSEARKQAALRLDQAVMSELKPLKLDKARFATKIEALPESQWCSAGIDRVEFEVATNPGSAFGAIGKIASGGELSRFMLALKVVLAALGTAKTIIFDEVDSGIGGATAAAVGERLARLGHSLQVLVVTHSPQVAARGDHHWRVAKSVQDERMTTDIALLSKAERQEEIARMLAGETITDHARAAAASLMSV